jgi:hypothetical protein
MPRNRALRILLFPVLAITFLIGWAMYSVGGKQPKQPLPRNAVKVAQKPADLEMGLMAEVEEEAITVEN